MLASLITLGLALLAGPVTVDEARLIAEEHAGGSLAPLPEVELDGGRRIGIYTDGTRQYRVDLATGAFLGWSEIPPVSGDPRPCNEDEAIALVSEEARRHVPVAADDLAWTVVGRAGDAIVIRGEGPKRGTPPRSGLSHSVVAWVSSTEGRVTSFAIDEPAPSPPMPVEVSREEAIAAAQNAVGDEAAAVVGEPSLSQVRDAARWSIELRDKVGDRYLVRINASTGEVMSVSKASLPQEPTGSASPPSPPVAAAEPDSTSPPWVLYGGIALLCAVALGVFLLRRRLN